jgi:hypothetical protein
VRVYFHKSRVSPLTERSGTSTLSLSDFDFSNDDSSNSEEDEKVKHKPCFFTVLCIMGKSSRHIFDSDSDVSDDLSHDGVSLRIAEHENALCH